MLAHTGDWYRLISVELQDEFLKKRRAAAAHIAAELNSRKPDELLSFVDFAFEAIGGPESRGAATLDFVLQKIIEEEPSALSAEVGSTLDPRICAAIALGEYLATVASTQKAKSTQLIAAHVVVSLLRYQPNQEGDYVQRRREALLQAAEQVLERGDVQRRRRRDSATLRFHKSLDEENVDWKAALKAFSSGIQEEMLKDREELQALWWVFGNYSYSVAAPFSTLHAGSAALLAAHELNEIVKSPATASFCALAARVANTARGAQEASTLAELLRPVTSTVWDLIAPTGALAEKVRRNPSLFPILSLTLKDSKDPSQGGGSTNHLSIRADTSFTAAALAGQVFTERALLTLLESPR